MALLDGIGFAWERDPHQEAWDRGVRALREYRRRFGNLNVPQKHVDANGFNLGVWVGNVRRRRAGLSAQRVAELEELGMRWDAAPAAVFSHPRPADRAG